MARRKMGWSERLDRAQDRRDAKQRQVARKIQAENDRKMRELQDSHLRNPRG